MKPTRAWPEISWKPARHDEEWVRTRIEQLALKVRRFEAALEQAGEEESADLSALGSELQAWDSSAAPVFVHTGLGEGRPLVAHELPSLVRALESASMELGEQRAELLDKLGAAADRVLELEETVALDPSILWVQPDDQKQESEGEAWMLAGEPEPLLTPPDDEEIAANVDPDDPVDAPQEADPLEALARERLGVDFALRTATCETLIKPVSAEELRMRQRAEEKPLPDDLALDGLLENLPSEWLEAVAAHLALAVPARRTMAGRISALRKAVDAHLRAPESLKATVANLGAPEQKLLVALLRADEPLPYARIVAAAGTDEADGFNWSQRPPSGPLSRLRRSGLAFVGGRDGKAAVAVPADLAAPLRALLALD